jgi:peptidoglycan/LPS O-acetylase OafA/YrhL
LVALPASWHRFGFVPDYIFMLSVTFFGRCFEFLGGMCLGLLWLRQAPILRWLSQRISCTVAGGTWIVSCLGLLVANHVMPWGEQWAEWGRLAINNVIVVPGMCLLLYGLMRESAIQFTRQIQLCFLPDSCGSARPISYLAHNH